jgi:hypothetical protein
MKKFFSDFLKPLRSMDRNDLTYWLGLIMMFVGLTWLVSVFVALTVVGLGIAIESVITSYLVTWFNTKNRESE